MLVYKYRFDTTKTNNINTYKQINNASNNR